MAHTDQHSQLKILNILRDKRTQAKLLIGICLGMLTILFLSAMAVNSGLEINFLAKKLAPSLQYPFGTDWLGRDMFSRTLVGLRNSLIIGLLAAVSSSIIALSLGLCAATLGKRVDNVISFIIDVIMSTPHLVLLVLIAYACGGGAKGVIIAVAVSHWTHLARIIRAEVFQIRSSQYVKISAKLGKSKWWIARHHILPHLLAQFLIGLVLTFPHSILHAAGLTFLGFGVSPHTPSIGMLLSESTRHLSTGYWWLAIIPGISLVVTVKLFDVLGSSLRTLIQPHNK